MPHGMGYDFDALSTYCDAALGSRPVYPARKRRRFFARCPHHLARGSQVLTASSQWKVAGIVALSTFSTRNPSWSRALAPKNGQVALVRVTGLAAAHRTLKSDLSSGPLRDRSVGSRRRGQEGDTPRLRPPGRVRRSGSHARRVSTAEQPLPAGAGPWRLPAAECALRQGRDAGRLRAAQRKVRTRPRARELPATERAQGR